MINYTKIKAQLRKHHKKLIERVIELGWLNKGETDALYSHRSRLRFVVDQLIFCKDEIDQWIHYEMNHKEATKLGEKK